MAPLLDISRENRENEGPTVVKPALCHSAGHGQLAWFLRTVVLCVWLCVIWLGFVQVCIVVLLLFACLFACLIVCLVWLVV